MSYEDGLLKLGKMTSRRSMLARMAKLALGAVGIVTAGTAPLLVSQENALATNCGDWFWCGLWGVPCDQCSDGAIGSCPSNMYRGSTAWSFCCCIDFWGCWNIFYYDCCNPYGPVGCGIDSCHNNPYGQQMTWCPGSPNTVYHCSVAITGSAC